MHTILDNGGILYELMRNSKNMSFVREVYDGNAYYFARNRSAKRFLRSKRIKKLELEINFELMAIA